ncbi:MAG TPA: hypothetical protein PK358_15225 [Spirochaetota bacterium]|nr:hypothetical protein [Spirochaetota bacterium]HPJ36191.1 hypothetical protein [Spirochaetota bacterium]
MINRIYLIIKELGGGKFISFIVFSVILLSVVALLSFSILSDNFNNYINKKFASAIPPDVIKVKPGESKSIFLFSTGSGKELNATAIKRMYRIKGVAKVDPVMAVTVPSSATIYFFSFQYRTDLICAGASYNFVRNDLRSQEMKRAWRMGTHERGVPVLVPKTLIDSYNNGLAAANGLPEIIPARLSGLKFKLSFGRSSVAAYEGAFDSSSVVAGYTDKVNITGLVIPIKTAREINKKYGKSDRYMFALVKVKDHKNIGYVKSQIRKMGYVIETGESLSAEILKLRKAVNAFILTMMTLVSALAALTVGLCSVTAVWGRIDYYRILRTLGASKFFIALTILVKFAVMGALATLAGIYIVNGMKEYAASMITIPGVKLILDISRSYMLFIISAGTIIPVVSSLPAIIRMFAVKLDRN